MIINNKTVIHEKKSKKIHPLQRFVNLFYLMTLIFSIVLIIGPPILLILFEKAWILSLFLFIFLGFWIMKKSVQQIRMINRNWKNRFTDPDDDFPYDNVGIEIQPDERTKATKKLSFKQRCKASLMGYILLIVGVFCAIFLAEKGAISEESLFPGTILLLLASIIYFHQLKPYLRWYHLFSFAIESYIIILIVGVAIGKPSKTAYSMTTSILGTSMIYILISWIPYLIIKKRKQRN